MKKQTIIKDIQRIIKEFGEFSTADIEAGSSPVVNSFGKDSFELAERFSFSKVSVISYVHETEVDDRDVNYEDLSIEVLEEILTLAEDYEASEIQTEKRISD